MSSVDYTQKSATPQVAGVPLFFDDLESGDSSHTQNGVSWAFPNFEVLNTHGLGGGYALNLLQPKTEPWLSGLQGTAERDIFYPDTTIIAIDCWLKCSANFVHAVRHNGKTWANCSTTAGTPALTSSSSVFAVKDVGRPVSIPGAGVAGAALQAWISSYTSPTSVTLDRNASVSVGPLTVGLLVKPSNNKLISLRGGAYTAFNRAKVTLQYVPDNIPEARHGDARLEVLHCVNGGETPFKVGTNGSTADPQVFTDYEKITLFSDASTGFGIPKGEYGRFRVLVNLGTGPGNNDGTIKVWIGDTLAYSTVTANLWPIYDGGASGDPLVEILDDIKLLGPINSGFYEDTRFNIDNVSIHTSDPGW